jgi:type I restriction enzyme M protein
MFEQIFKNIDDILYKDAGCDSELDYTAQTSWILFLRYLDELEEQKKSIATLTDRQYTPIIESAYKWKNWATPVKDNGEIDFNKTITGPDLISFVNTKLFPYLASFKQKASSPKTIEYKIGEIFSELGNKIESGYNLREILNYAHKLNFNLSKEKHELSSLYENKIKNMGNAGRNGGQYYTPRALIRSIIKVINPQIGKTIYDGACGSAGFLCEAFDYLRNQKKLSATDLKILKEGTLYGKEKKNLAYIIGVMNLILHGVETPNIIHTNTLSEDLSNITEEKRFDVILANPPFGGKENAEIKQNFPIKTGETAFLFLQHFIKSLKAGGSAGIVIKNTFLSNTDSASVSLRKHLLESCNLHTILDMPAGTFTGAGVKTVVLFFQKGQPTQNIWYYQLDPKRNLGKTNALNDDDMFDFITLYADKKESENSWTINTNSLDENFDLSVKNPNSKDEVAIRHPDEIIKSIELLQDNQQKLLKNIKELL